MAIPHSKNVLLVEDSMDDALMLTLELDHIGCACTVAKSADEALKIIRGGAQFDFVLMDVHMPGLDGIVATQAIRAWEKETGAVPNTIIGLTGVVQDQQIFMKAGMNDCIIKPLRVSELKEKLAA